MKKALLSLGCLALLGLALFVAALPLAEASPFWVTKGAYVIVDRSWSDAELNVSAKDMQWTLARWIYPKGVRVIRIHDLPPLNEKGPFSEVRVQSWRGGRIDVYARGMGAYEVAQLVWEETQQFQKSPNYFSAAYR